jgi:hypothetical protein
LIQAHLDIFKHLEPIFRLYFETWKKVNTDARNWKALKKRNRIFGIPPMMTFEKFWKK